MFRRLCPGLAFFQNATLHTLDVLDAAAGTYETLRVRVERSVLKSQNISRNRLGFTAANVIFCCVLFFSNSKSYLRFGMFFPSKLCAI